MTEKLQQKVAHFWTELKRRRVVSTTVAYLIGAWLLIETTATVFPLLLLPEWTVRMIVVLAAIGLPIVVALAWVFDIRRSSAVSVAADTVEGYTQQNDNTTASRSRLPREYASVSVMRFENLSTEEKYKFFGYGIATELHNTLAQVHRIQVASRTSSFALSGGDNDVRQIGARLNVDYVVSGSIMCAGDRMRVIAELDSAPDGVQLWSKTFDRDIGDLFSVQQEIASAITSALGGAMLREEIENAASRQTDSLDAWQLVQKARSYLIAYSPESLANARDLLNRAVALDANYAVAHATLGTVIAEQVLNALCKPGAGDYEAALQSAETASSLSQSDPFVLKSCGLVWAYFGEHRKSLESLRRAVNVAPFDLGAWGYHGWPLVETGVPADQQEAAGIMDRKVQTSPRHPGAPFWIYHQSVIKICTGELDAAVKLAASAAEMNPSFAWGWMHYANTLGQVDDLKGARAAAQRCQAVCPNLTPTHFADMIRKMSATSDIARTRISGLGQLHG